jgi:hypothetical protein
MIPITLNNDDTVDLFIAAIDKNQPGTPVVFNKRLNSRAVSEVINVQEDGNGRFLINTTATDANDPTRTSTKDHTGSSGDSVPVDLS